MAQLFDLSFEHQAKRPNAQKIITGQGFQTLSICFAVGQALPAHIHPNMNVLVHVVRGQVALSSDGERLLVSQGQLALFSGDIMHSLENTHSDETHVVVTAIPKPG
jgi:quercetin dioxygenase-like cupin family protein